jgi:hypothetical protein
MYLQVRGKLDYLVSDRGGLPGERKSVPPGERQRLEHHVVAEVGYMVSGRGHMLEDGCTST